MAAAATDLVTEVGSPGTATTLSAPGYTIGDASITVASTTNWPTATGVIFAIDRAELVDGVETRVTGTYNEFVGTVASATSITNLSKLYGSAQNYSAGSLTRVYIPVASQKENRLVTWATAQHTQLGAHTAITATSLAATGDISSSAGKITTTAVGKLEDYAVPLSTYRANTTFDHVVSGSGVWSADAAGSTRAASMTALVCMINGRRIAISAVNARTFTASKDTYIDVLDNADGTGTLVYTEATNDAASPALASNSLRIAIVVTAAGSIASAAKINQGQITATSPTISSNILLAGLDSLGNSVYPTNPNQRKINYQAPLQADQNVTATSFTDITNATFTYKSGAVPETLYLWANAMFGLNVSASTYVTISIDGTDQNPGIFWNVASVHRGSQLYTYRVAASTTIIIKFRAKTSANTLTFYENDVLYAPTIRGYATR
jgi:hypothetical protein